MKSGQKQSNNNNNNKKSRGRAEPEQKSLRHKELCSEGAGRGSQQLKLQKTAKAERFVREGGKGRASGQMVFISALLALAFEMSENSATKRRCRNYPGMAHTAGVYCLQSQLQWAL